MRFIASAVLIMVTAAAAVTSSKPLEDKCSAAFGKVASADRVGLVSPGMTVSAFRKLCPQARVEKELGSEAQPIMVIRLHRPSPAIRLDVDGGRIVTIIIQDPTIVDYRGEQVGSALKKGPGRKGLTGFEADGDLYLRPNDTCGFAYYSDYELADNEHRATWTEADIQKLGTLRVKEISIAKC